MKSFYLLFLLSICEAKKHKYTMEEIEKTLNEAVKEY